MTEPLIHWEPSKLRQIGIALMTIGIASLMLKPLNDMGMNDRTGAVVGALLAAMAYYSYQNHQWMQQSLALLSAVLAVVLPLAVCLHAFRVMVET